MTGQVKEDILSRLIELGVRIVNGQLAFDPFMFEACEILKTDSRIQFINLEDEHVELSLPAGSFAFTLCQTPIIYHQSMNTRIVVTRADGADERDTLTLTKDETASIFSRTGQIKRIDIHYDFQQVP
jgi:hypothetical protein